MRFFKFQALGNDYLVLEATDAILSPALVRAVCDRHLGVGADGVLVEDVAPDGALAPDGRLAVRILNPDGSEAEKSGNGLRIFARYLWDHGRVGGEAFELTTKGGVVRCQVRDAGRMVFVEMGAASFDSAAIPVAGPHREVVNEELEAAGERLRVTAVSVGNPHCVVFVDAPTPELARRLGPALEAHLAFPQRTNVQIVRVVDRDRIAMEIWERGAGYTLASGSSACAAAAASVRLGLCDGAVTVAMPGGDLEIGVGADFAVTLLGPVRKVAEGIVAEDLLSEAGGRGGTVDAPPPTAAGGPAAARGATAAIAYRIDQPISLAQFVSVLRRSMLGERLRLASRPGGGPTTPVITGSSPCPTANTPLVVPSFVSREVRPMGTLPAIIPISDLRQDTAGVIKRVVASDEPAVITQRGRATAVLVSAEAYERMQHENEILRVLANGDAEIAAGLGRDAEDVMAEARALLSGE